MKLHLPVLLRKALLACFAFTFAWSKTVFAADLTLGSTDSLTIDYAGADSIPDLDGGALTLKGDTLLLLSNCSSGDGKTYTLLTGVGDLQDAEGNPLTLTDENNAASLYFDTTQPGTGFWGGGWLQLTSEGHVQLVLHGGEVQETLTISTRQTGSKTYNYYEGTCFRDITYTLSGTSSAYGGAIYGESDSTITLSNNGSVSFSGNTASSSDFLAYGGAINGKSDSTITLSNNGSVVFTGNKALASEVAQGGAIYGDGDITLCNNGSVRFCGNSAFVNQTGLAGSYSPSAYGGAINSGRYITLDNNDCVEFVENEATGVGAMFYGGAIYGNTTLRNNGSVTFRSNKALLTSGDVPGPAEGGAIYGSAIALINNESVTFSANISAFGGAISGGSTIMLINNGSVAFSENNAVRCGGAIYADGNLSIQNNDFVLFERNVQTGDGFYRLHSVYADYYRVGYEEEKVVSLSAAENKSIEFRDSIFIDSGRIFNLNGDYIYQNADGASVSVNQRGDIIFTGETTIDDLFIAKGNVAGTAEEILASRTSEVKTIANLYNGRLIIKEGAIWSGDGITVASAEGKTYNPTLLLQNGHLSHYEPSDSARNVVTIKSGATLEVAGKNTASYTSLIMQGGSTLTFNLSAANTSADTAVLSMSDSSLTLPLSGTVTLKLVAFDGISDSQAYALLTGVNQPASWNNANITVASGTNGWDVSVADLCWDGTTLWLYYDTRPDLETATWTNESGDGKWNTSSVNWEQNEIDYEYKNGVAVVFDGQGAGTVELVGELAPGSVLVNNAAGQDYTFGGSGSLTGDMKLTKKGAGNLTISTANSYTGGTVVNGGKLIAGHNNAFGSGDVTVNNGGTLDLSTYVVPNKVFMNGTSTLANANGASHIVLGGGSQVSFSNGFTLGSGKTLEVATGGATYTGALTLGGGTLLLADKLTVQGDVVFEAGKQTTIDISGWSAAGDGTVLVEFGNDHSGYAEDCLTLSGITGDWELDFNTATGVLTLVAVKEDFRPNLDRNQQEVYDTMKDIMAGGNPGGVLGLLGQNIVGSRDEAALKRALDEICGREYATIMSSQVEGNLGHLRRLRAAAGMGTPLGEYVTFNCCYPSNKGVDKSDNKGATVMMAPSPVLDSRRIRAGVSAFHEQAELDADSNGDGFERSETGAQLTMEYLVSNDFVFGMGLSHSRTKLTPTFGKRRDEDNTHVDLYGVYQSGRWSSTTALGVGLHQHELGRTVAGMQTQAEADGLSVNFMQELAYSVYADEEQGLQVFGSVESSFNQVDAFSETGAGNASLCVEEQDAWVTDVTLGLRYNHTLPALGKAPAGMFSVQGGVVASLGDTEPEATLRFAGAPGYSYKQYAAERSRWGYSVGASVNMPVSASTAVFGTAEAVLRNNAYTVDAQVGVKMAF